MASLPVFSVAGWKWLVRTHPVVSFASAALGLYLGLSAARKISPDRKETTQAINSQFSESAPSVESMRKQQQENMLKIMNAERKLHWHEIEELRNKIAVLEKEIDHARDARSGVGTENPA